MDTGGRRGGLTYNKPLSRGQNGAAPCSHSNACAPTPRTAYLLYARASVHACFCIHVRACVCVHLRGFVRVNLSCMCAHTYVPTCPRCPHGARKARSCAGGEGGVPTQPPRSVLPGPRKAVTAPPCRCELR